MKDEELRRRADFSALQDEIAGRPNGQVQRFLTSEVARAQREGGRDETSRASALTELQLLLLEPAYSEAYECAFLALDALQARLDAALLAATQAIETLEELSDQLEDRALHLPDGTAVFMAADGSVYTADGRRLSEAEAASLRFPEDAPSWEQFGGVKEALRGACERRNHLLGIQGDVVDPARDRLTDPDNPPSLEELDELRRRLEDADTSISELESSATAFESAAAGPQFEFVDETLVADLSLDIPSR